MTTNGAVPGAVRRQPRIFAVLFALLVVLPVSFVVTAVLLRNPIINSDPIREEITATLQRLTGRDVELIGRIEIDDFPWIKVVIGPGSFGSGVQFVGPPLLTWQEITARVHYSTLYEDSPLIDRIIVTGLEVDLRRDKQGRDNWSDIGPLDAQGPPQAALAIPGIDFRNLRIRYTDETTSPKPLATLDRLTLTVDGVSRGAGAVEGARWRVASLGLDGTLASAQINGPVVLRLKGIDARVPDGAEPALDVKSILIEHRALRAMAQEVIFRPPNIAAAVKLEPVAIESAVRMAGIEPPFRSGKNLMQLKDFSAKVQYDGTRLNVDEFAAWIDDTRLRGKVSLSDPIRLSLEADSVDVDKYAVAFGDSGPYDPEAPLAFPGKLLQELPIDGQIRVGRISARGANLIGVTLRLESRSKGASTPR